MDLMEMELTAQVRILLKGGNVTPLHYFIVWIEYVKDSVYIHLYMQTLTNVN